MENETTLNAENPAGATGVATEESQVSQPEERKYVPMPTDKLRELNQAKRERDLLLAERERNLSTSPKSTLTEEQEKALDLIGDRASRFVRKEIKEDLSAVRDELDTNRLENYLVQMENDPKTARYRDEFVPALKELMVENPEARPSQLLEQARSRALTRAFDSGKLLDTLAEEAEERVITKTRAGGAPGKGASSTGRGASEPSIDDMGPEELAKHPELVEQYFEQTQGRKSRR